MGRGTVNLYNLIPMPRRNLNQTHDIRIDQHKINELWLKNLTRLIK